jgi:hypothetical protein
LQRLLADAPDRMQHDGNDDRFEPVENRPDGARLAVHGRNVGQHQHAQGARQHEQGARRNPAPCAVQAPADIGGKLLRFGARQQSGERKPAQETALADPTLLVDEIVLHHRDLPGGPAEGQAAQLEPIGEGGPVARPVAESGGGSVGHCSSLKMRAQG